ncbi:general transcription factor II-I repeat domain-containing 2A-like [Pelobates cultripes]|uniref:General transcription factor II-I repeat domain-containing 2A-like n=1 Tax=Pelobates cultripes TaxID=61616 RepID=A0AAD1TIP4_PELCU|nr:general transcription factor II-I repeat domain-containing 2A-like [Pelobates cultripes]
METISFAIHCLMATKTAIAHRWKSPLTPTLPEILGRLDSTHAYERMASRLTNSQNLTSQTQKMCTAKKAKFKTDSGRSFQETWTESFGVIERNGKALCILCSESVVSRTSSVRRHFDTNHKSVAKLGESERKEFLKESLRKYHSQYRSFSNYLAKSNHLTVASFQISLCIAKHDFTAHFNVLNKKLQGVGKIAERMFCDIRTFERKLQVFERDIESGQLKYFPNLKIHLENSTIFTDNPPSHQEIHKELSSIVAAAKENFSNRFLQFRKMETTLYFLTSPDKAKYEELDISCLLWLDLENLEMELLDFQESSIWKNKFYALRATLEKIECEGMTTDSTVGSSENEILKVWNSLPNNFKSMKALGIALLSLFGSSYACEQLFSALNYIKSDTRNRLTDELSAACVALKLTEYEPRFDKCAVDIYCNCSSREKTQSKAFVIQCQSGIYFDIRNVSQCLIGFFGRLLYFCMGFHVRIQGNPASAMQAPILVVAPHSSFFDGVAVIASGMPSTVSREENVTVPIFGRILRALQPVLVSRVDPNSRKNTINEIKKRAMSGGEWPQVLMFPEGTCTNRSCLISFKPVSS